MQKESKFKTNLYKEIREECPGTEVIINDPTQLQGFPDATVLFPNGKYMLLEGKREEDANRQPNQEYYVNQSPLAPNAHFVYPENKNEIMEKVKRRYKE